MEKKGVERIYIPKRIYNRLKTIYTSKVTVVAAPDGSGRSTFLSEFVFRSRKSGVSCRFIRNCESSEDCFARLCSIVLGFTPPIPVSDEEERILRDKFREARMDKDTVVIIDDIHADEMLFSRIRVALLADVLPVRLVITTTELDDMRREVCRRLGFSVIDGECLRLTPEEAREYFDLCGVHSEAFEKICAISGGMMMRLRLALLLCGGGIALPESGELLLESVIQNVLTKNERCAIFTAVSFQYLEDEYCRDLASNKVLRDYFGEGMFLKENILCLIDGISRL
ncbi:MAG: ATP-binding protein, partial [Oscillospiraceae bacterium]